MRKVKLDLRSSSNLVIQEVEVIWNMARIPTQKLDRCILKVEALYKEWKSLQKSCKRRSAVQIGRENIFLDKIDDLFDIAHCDALEMMKIEEDKSFLISQRQKGRPGSMTGCDLNQYQKEQKRIKLDKRRSELQRKEQIRRENQQNIIYKNIIGTESSSDDEQFPDSNRASPTLLHDHLSNEVLTNKGKKRKQHTFITPKLVATLDKCKVSDRDAIRILVATAEALNHDVNDLVISKSSIRRCRKRSRNETANALREEFFKKKLEHVTLHWLGKILPSLTGKEKVDRLPIIITSGETEHMLGIPQISSSTGKEQASAILKLLEDWNLTDKVALCCDTTASNLGRLKGCSVILEQKLGRDLLYLPCRHHMYEIVLRSAFNNAGLENFGPTLSIFQRFQKFWSKINISDFSSWLEDPKVNSSVNNVCEILQFASSFVDVKHPREDYKEFLYLAMIFFGKIRTNYSFKPPGAFHHASWMAKAIYSLKFFLFRNQFSMSKIEEYAIREACIFIVKIYLKPWILAKYAVRAPNQDLIFLKHLLEYKNINKSLGEEAIRKFSNHLWYLSPEAVALSFFDPDITIETKRKMTARLTTENSICKKIVLANLSYYQDKGIETFIGTQALKFFERFSISTKFMEKDPAEWETDENFRLAFNKVNKLYVVNDIAERGVKLMEDYNNVLSKDELEKQFIIQVVLNYKKEYINVNKSTLSK